VEFPATLYDNRIVVRVCFLVPIDNGKSNFGLTESILEFIQNFSR
jgi:hypothetical protein